MGPFKVNKMLEFKLKICLLGDGAVGKTSLIRKFVYDEFDDQYLMTFGAKTTKKLIGLSNPKDGGSVQMTLMISDIMGQKDVSNVHDAYMFGTKGAIIVCDITRKETLESVQGWMDKVNKISGDVPMVFVANKYDLSDEAQFDIDDLKEIAEGIDCQAYVSSARTGENVELAFITLSEALLALRV